MWDCTWLRACVWVNWSHRLSLTKTKYPLLCAFLSPRCSVPDWLGDQLRDYFWYQAFEIWYHCLFFFCRCVCVCVFWLKHLESPPINSRGRVSSVFTFTVSAVTTTCLSVQSWWPKKKRDRRTEREREREDSADQTKTPWFSTHRPESSRWITVRSAYMILSSCERVYVSKRCISVGHYLNPD